MNETIRQLYERKSVRVFEDRAIDEAIVREILLAASMAPTAGNQQLYTILRITDPALLKRLSETCDDQPFIADTKLALVFCADCLKWYDAFTVAGADPRRPGVGDFLLAVGDAMIAAENAVTAAESYGIGSCYIGDIMENCETHRELLGLPEYVFPAAFLIFGYPTEQQKTREKPARTGLAYLVQENRYRRYTEEELRDLFAQKAADGDFDGWMKRFCARKYNSDFAREMTRSVGEYLKQYKSSCKTIYLAGGCFWGVQKYMDQFRGVVETEVGYANGPDKAPSYEEVCRSSGHAETVRVVYDESLISLEELLEKYFLVIDPVAYNRQGPDVGVQYRTGIFYADETQLPAIEAVYAAEEKKAGEPLAVEVKPLTNFFPAEDYHQKYLDKNPNGYCHIPRRLLGK